METVLDLAGRLYYLFGQRIPTAVLDRAFSHAEMRTLIITDLQIGGDWLVAGEVVRIPTIGRTGHFVSLTHIVGWESARHATETTQGLRGQENLSAVSV